MSKLATATQPQPKGFRPNITSTSHNDRIVITYTERTKLKEVRCKCGKLQCKATPGSVVETKCGCGKTEVYKVAA